MGNPSGFLQHSRQEVAHRPVRLRVKDFQEVDLPLPEEKLRQQAERCMDCGIPFCHAIGCPVLNRIPEFNELVYEGRWQEACENLHATNNFPEITGRICPAPCETSCTLSINDDPVLIRHIELQIAERGFEAGWIKPLPAAVKTHKRVAIVGSGPSGLAAAQQLARAGHDVSVFDKNLRPGGLLRYGIPDFKLDKRVLDRRVEQMQAEGVDFQNGVTVGEDVSSRYLRSRYDAVLLTMGAGQPRDLSAPGRDLAGVYFAMDYLSQQNRINSGEGIGDSQRIDANGAVVVVIGGGDTGSDCVGTAIRQGAKEAHLFELLPKPPETSNPDTPWPMWPQILRTTSSHDEGAKRRWSILTKELIGSSGRVEQLKAVQVNWDRDEAGKWQMTEDPGTEFSMKADLVLLAMGFVHVTHPGLVEQFDLDLDQRGNIAVDDSYATSVDGVFAAGDSQLGASLVVRGIYAGRQVAASIDAWLRR